MGYGSGHHAIFPSLTWQCNPQAEKVAGSLPPGGIGLDLGAGGRRIYPDIKTVDFIDSGDTDLIADVTRVPLPDSSVDLIIATGLLEHVKNEHDLLSECSRLLRPGGRIHIELPFLQQFHADPIDMRRYTIDGLKELVGRYGFDVEAADFHIGPSLTIATLNAHYAAMLFEDFGIVGKIVSNGVFLVMSVIGWPLKFLDRYVRTKKRAYQLAFGIFVTARRKTTTAPGGNRIGISAGERL